MAAEEAGGASAVIGGEMLTDALGSVGENSGSLTLTASATTGVTVNRGGTDGGDEPSEEEPGGEEGGDAANGGEDEEEAAGNGSGGTVTGSPSRGDGTRSSPPKMTRLGVLVLLEAKRELCFGGEVEVGLSSRMIVVRTFNHPSIS